MPVFCDVFCACILPFLLPQHYPCTKCNSDCSEGEAIPAFIARFIKFSVHRIPINIKCNCCQEEGRCRVLSQGCQWCTKLKARLWPLSIWISTSQPKYPDYAQLMCPDRALHLVTLLPDQVTHNTAHTPPASAGQWVIELWPVSSLTQSPPATSIL